MKVSDKHINALRQAIRFYKDEESDLHYSEFQLVRHGFVSKQGCKRFQETNDRLLIYMLLENKVDEEVKTLVRFAVIEFYGKHLSQLLNLTDKKFIGVEQLHSISTRYNFLNESERQLNDIKGVVNFQKRKEIADILIDLYYANTGLLVNALLPIREEDIALAV